jgi:hypothetical protein
MTYDLIFSKAHPPKVGAVPPAEIIGIPFCETSFKK